MNALPPAPVAPTGGAELSSEAIEHSLRELWEQMDDGHGDVTQVRMLNLIVFLPESPSPEIRSMINAVAVQHPGRTIMLLPDDGPPRAEATIACRVDSGQRHACGEQVVLRGTAGGDALHSLAVALLLAGLPVTVWWHGPIRFDDHVFQQLAKVADHFVLDSSTWPDPLRGLALLREAMADWQPTLRFSDLRWVELTGWRRVIAQAFDVPVAREVLAGLHEVVVEYGSPSGLNVAALLLVSWLASRLGWSAVDSPPARDITGRVLQFRSEAGDREISVALRRRDSTGTVCGVEMRSAGRQSLHCSFELTPDGGCIRTHIDLHGSAPLTQVTSLKRRSLSALLGDELAIGRADPVYVSTLDAAVDIVERLQVRR